MKLSEAWLREWVNPSVSVTELAEQLTMAGLEVDSVSDAAAKFTNVVVGKVLTINPHPDADKLRICEVDTGDGKPLQIVCGAANVKESMSVPTAIIGARLPGDFKIKKSKLRGVESFGMLCSEKELGLAEISDGLMELPSGAPIGKDVREYFNLEDHIIEIELTPNRGDCLSVAGIAREVGVLNKCPVGQPDIPPAKESIQDTFPVSVKVPEHCPRYLGRVIRNIRPDAQTPLWMQEKLRRGGIRSLGPMVDVTNYVMLELGHPMHAFDLDQLQGEVQIRMASKNEKLTLLDGKEIELVEDTLLISDKKRPLALAGIMGGQDSGISDSTKNLFLECAYFNPISISGKARDYGLQTDSSHRFERGVNPESLHLAMERATGLLLDIVGGDAGPISEVSSEEHLPVCKPIILRSDRISRLLGIKLPDAEIQEILERLGMSVTACEGGWDIVAPTFRFDIEIEADLIEEVGRIYGYNRLPASHSTVGGEMHPRTETRLEQSRLSDTLINRGYQEVVTYSFIDPADQQLFDPDKTSVRLANPISSEMAVMRTSLWPGLIRTIMYNLNRQQSTIHIFESGLKFTSQDNEIKQEYVISGALYGDMLQEQWAEKGRKVDFYDLKGDVEALLQLTGQQGQKFTFEPVSHPALHPGQSASVLREGKNIGVLGAIHPKVLQNLGVSANIYVFELDVDDISHVAIPKFHDLSKYPSIRRDIAIVVDEQIAAGDIQACIAATLPDILKDTILFDVYKGKGIDSGRKSLALGLILQESSRTLIDKDVDTAIDKVMKELKQRFGATLRD